MWEVGMRPDTLSRGGGSNEPGQVCEKLSGLELLGVQPLLCVLASVHLSG